MTLPRMDQQAKRVRIYIGESDQWRGKPLYAALLDVFKEHGLAGATVVRGVAGYGAHSMIHTAAVVRLSQDLPLVVEVVDTAEKIETALTLVGGMVHEGLVTVEDVQVILYTHRALHPLRSDRPVRDVMTPNPKTVSIDQPALEAWKAMVAQALKALPVVDAENRVVGILTEDDLVERVGVNARMSVARQLDEDMLQAELDILRQANRMVGEVMTRPVVTVSPEDGLGIAAEKLKQHEITRLPVVDRDGRLVGMLSRLDLLQQVMDGPTVQAAKEKDHFVGQSVGEVFERASLKPSLMIRETTDLAGMIAAFLKTGEHRLVVTDAKGVPTGLVADSDLIGRIQPELRQGVLAALRGREKAPDSSLLARDILSPGVESVDLHMPLMEAVRRMVLLQRKWLVVVDDSGRAVGIIDRAIALAALI